MTLNDIKKAVVEALEDIKAFDIQVIDVRKITTMTSFMVIASANSIRQTKALAYNVCKKMKLMNVHINGIEGEKEGEWVLVDADDVIVHIMLPTTRAYYNLEQLWVEPSKKQSPKKN
jgi:ribosome-associated protein